MTGREIVLSIVTAFAVGALIAVNLPQVIAQQQGQGQGPVQPTDAFSPFTAAAGDGQGRVYFHVWRPNATEIMYRCQDGKCQQINVE